MEVADLLKSVLIVREDSVHTDLLNHISTELPAFYFRTLHLRKHVIHKHGDSVFVGGANPRIPILDEGEHDQQLQELKAAEHAIGVDFRLVFILVFFLIDGDEGCRYCGPR